MYVAGLDRQRFCMSTAKLSVQRHPLPLLISGVAQAMANNSDMSVTSQCRYLKRLTLSLLRLTHWKPRSGHAKAAESTK